MVNMRYQLTTLYRRRMRLLAGNPRELVVPLLTPVLFAVIIAPALKNALGSFNPSIDYMTFVAIATVALLVPLNSMFSGIGAMVDRLHGGLRELLAAPVPRWFVPLANVLATLTIAALQVAVLVGAAVLRGAVLHTSAGGVVWFAAAALLLAAAVAGIAEMLAFRLPTQEEYVALVPAIAIVPWFFAGSLFPITALPSWLTDVAKIVPWTHALALMRYGLVGAPASGLHAIWGWSSPTAMALASLAVVTAFAAALLVLATTVFRRSAVQ
jgi:ABC-2 type transport system permease protein